MEAVRGRSRTSAVVAVGPPLRRSALLSPSRNGPSCVGRARLIRVSTVTRARLNCRPCGLTFGSCSSHSRLTCYPFASHLSSRGLNRPHFDELGLLKKNWGCIGRYTPLFPTFASSLGGDPEGLGFHLDRLREQDVVLEMDVAVQVAFEVFKPREEAFIARA